MWKVPLFKLNYDNQESFAVQKVLKSEWLSMGKKTLNLESQFNRFLNIDFGSVAVSSCTAAIHLSLLAANVKKGDEVIVPSLSFISQLNIIKNIGARPILVDCDSLDNWNMNTEMIIKKITSKTRAIIILHYAGFPCEISKNIKNICKINNISIIEDVAHAPGAIIEKQMCGTIGDFGCFSFFSNKNISAGEGGMVVAKTKKLEKKLRLLRSHGMTHISFDKEKGRAFDYDVIEPGLNYRIDEIRSVLAIEQLKKLKSANNLRKKHYHLYQSLLKDTEIIFPFSKYNKIIKGSYHIAPILLPKNINRKKVIESLQNKGIQTSIHYIPYWLFSQYKNGIDKTEFLFCEEITKRQLTLPLFPSMSDKDISYVCESLKSTLI